MYAVSAEDRVHIGVPGAGIMMVVSYQVGAGIRTWVLWKEQLILQPLSHIVSGSLNVIGCP